jgi:hypothetical protein
MGATDLLSNLLAQGFRVQANGDRIVVGPRERITETIRALIRENKQALLAALRDPGAAVRRARVIAMLAAHPEVRYAVATETEIDPDSVIVTIAIRGVATCELHVPRGKWDGTLFLDLLERHADTIH